MDLNNPNSDRREDDISTRTSFCDDYGEKSIANTPLLLNKGSSHLQDDGNSENQEGEEVISKQPNPDESNPLLIDVSTHFVTDEVFNSRDHLVQWCHEVGRKIGVVVVKKHSELAAAGRRGRLSVGCERGGQYRRNKKCNPIDSGKKSRKSGTKKCGCPFLIRGLPQEGDKWKLRVECGKHNHELSKELLSHSYAGRLKEEEIEIVRELTASGVSPRNILSTLKERNVDNMSTRKTVYNVRAKLRKEMQLSSHPIEDVTMDLDIQFELDAIKKKFEEGTVEEKKALKRKLEEIISSSSMLLEPPSKQVGMGRLPWKKTQSTEETKSDSSTKRDSSGLEDDKIDEK